MACISGKSAKDAIFISTATFRGAIIWLKIDVLCNGVIQLGKIAIAAPRCMDDTNITSKQDMQFTRELNARGSYVLD